MSLESPDLSTSSSPPCSGEETQEVNSLLTFADMVLALDHTYTHGDDDSAMFLDAECLVQKEKDHTYAVSGRGSRSKVHASLSSSPAGLQSSSLSKYPGLLPARRSSSEENLSRICASASDDKFNDFNNGTVSRKCHSFEKMFSPETKLKSVPIPKSSPAPPPQFSCLSKNPDCDSMTDTSASQWQRKDHTYAKAESDKVYVTVIMDCQESPTSASVEYGTERQEFPFTSKDHTYDKHQSGGTPSFRTTPNFQTTHLSNTFPGQTEKQMLQCDHTYFTVERRQSAPAGSHRQKGQQGPVASSAATETGNVKDQQIADRMPLCTDHTYSTLA